MVPRRRAGLRGVRIYASPKAGGDIAALEKALFKELDAAIVEGFKAEDIKRAKKLITAQAIYVRDGLRAGPNAIGQAFTQGQTIADVEGMAGTHRGGDAGTGN